MEKILASFESSPDHMDDLVRAAVAYSWFVTIHPVSDGNSRIARAVTNMAMTQYEKKDFRLYGCMAADQGAKDEAAGHPLWSLPPPVDKPLLFDFPRKLVNQH